MHQYLRGGHRFSTERQRGSQREQSGPDLQLPEEQDDQEEQGELIRPLTAANSESDSGRNEQNQY